MVCQPKSVFAAFILSVSLSVAPVANGEEPVVADPHRYDADIEAFEASDRENRPLKGQVLFLGSSSIRRWDTDDAFAGIESINRGFGGSQTSDCLHFFDRIVVPYQPSVIVFYEGDNDINAGKSKSQVLMDFSKFSRLVRRKSKGTKIVYIPIKPSIKREALWPQMAAVNERIRQWSLRRKDLYYADTATPMLMTGLPPAKDLFADDGLHLSDKGNALWASIVRPVLEEALRDWESER